MSSTADRKKKKKKKKLFCSLNCNQLVRKYLNKSNQPINSVTSVTCHCEVCLPSSFSTGQGRQSTLQYCCSEVWTCETRRAAGGCKRSYVSSPGKQKNRSFMSTTVFILTLFNMLNKWLTPVLYQSFQHGLCTNNSDSFIMKSIRQS